MQLVLVGSKAEAGLNRQLKEAVKAPIIDLTGKDNRQDAGRLPRKYARYSSETTAAWRTSHPQLGLQSLTIFGPSKRRRVVAHRQRALATGTGAAGGRGI